MIKLFYLTLTSTPKPGKRGTGSNSNKVFFCISKNSNTEASSSETV